MNKFGRVSVTSAIACATLLSTTAVASAETHGAGYKICGPKEHVLLNVAVSQSYVHWTIDSNGHWPGGRNEGTFLEADPAGNAETVVIDTGKRGGTWTVSTLDSPNGERINALHSAYDTCS